MNLDSKKVNLRVLNLAYRTSGSPWRAVLRKSPRPLLSGSLINWVYRCLRSRPGPRRRRVQRQGFLLMLGDLFFEEVLKLR